MRAPILWTGLGALALCGCRKIECGEGTTLNEDTRVCEPDLVDPDVTPPSGSLTVDVTGDGPFDVSWTPSDGSDASMYLVVRFPLDAWGLPDQSTSYAAGDDFPGGGTVVYVGSDTSTTDDPGTGRYQYVVWMADEARNYGAWASAWATDPFEPATATLTFDFADWSASITSVDGLDLDVHLIPSDADLAGAPVDLNAAHLIIDVRNDTALPLYNFKIVAPEPDESDITGTLVLRQEPPSAVFGDGEDDVGAAFTFGMHGIPAGGRAEAQWQLAGSDDASAILDVVVMTAPLVVAGHDWEQDGDGTRTTALDPSMPFQESHESILSPVDAYRLGVSDSGAGRLTGGVVAPSGTHMYVGSGNAPWIGVIDLTSFEVVRQVNLAGEHAKGSIADLQLGADGYLYAVFNDGRHGFRWGGRGRPGALQPEEPGHRVVLLKVDPRTLEVVDEVVVKEGPVAVVARGGSDPGSPHRILGRRFGLSVDGATAAIPIMRSDFSVGHDVGWGWLVLVDTATMSIAHEVSLEGVANPVAAAIDASGKAYTAGDYAQEDSRVAVVDIATGELSTIELIPSTARGESYPILEPKAFVRGPDGRVYGGGQLYDPALGTVDGFFAFDDGVATPIGHEDNDQPMEVMGVGWLPDGTALVMSYDDYSEVLMVDPATGRYEHVLEAFDGDSIYGNWIGATPF